jgi:hypothetical protein
VRLRRRSGHRSRGAAQAHRRHIGQALVRVRRESATLVCESLRSLQDRATREGARPTRQAWGKS